MRALKRSAISTDAASLPPAGLLRRLAALLYDTLAVAALFMLAGFLALVTTGGAAVPAGNGLFRMLLLAVGAAYVCASWVRGGQTLGMRAWRLRLVADDGRPISPLTAVLRLAAAGIALLPVGLGFLWMLFDRRRRTWHDAWTGTRVVLLSGNSPRPASRG
jgi:uncharacterized RDD family membrane protein YckC